GCDLRWWVVCRGGVEGPGGGGCGGGISSNRGGISSKSEAPRSGGSFLCLMEEVVKVGQTIGYNMEGVVNNLSDIIESHGESLVNR
ncbi:hypothetical protein Tco_0315297, partial [Tanacetum coccineum]